MQIVQDSNVVVTGATGWLGMATLERLEKQLGDQFERRVFAFASRRKVVRLRSGRTIACAPLAALSELATGPYLFLHYAFITKDRLAGLALPEFVRLNEEIFAIVSNTARRVAATGFFVPSSGAVYRDGRSLEQDLDRNPYGAMKLRDEERFTRLAEELQRPLVIARIFNLAGPYINKLRSYALGSILDDILHDRPVELRAAHRVVRSYVHVDDLISLALTSLGAEHSALFDTFGDVEIEIGELATLALDVLGKTGGSVRRPTILGGDEDRYVGDQRAIAALAAKYGIEFRSLRQQIQDTADFLAAA
jgi:nucleoside-diphosphate-sugar epimerase